MARRFLSLWLLALPVVAQPRQDGLEWAVALGGRFGEMHDPVVAAHALGRLAETICGTDAVAGAGLFQTALERLKLLTPESFASARRPLPVPSFTALWKTMSAAAAKCSPELLEYADTERAKAKMAAERQKAPDLLNRALSLAPNEPDRAEQLARAAITASDPALLDIPTLTLFLTSLRDRAGDLADEFFPEALDFVAGAKYPSPGLLLELGKYLFTAPKYRDHPDIEQLSDIRQVGDTSVAVFSANRRSSSSDDIRAYIEATLKVATATNDPYYDPVAAYAVVYQMMPKADDVAPDLVEELGKAVTQVAALAGSSAAQVQGAVGGSSGADPEGGEGPRKRDRLVVRVLSAAGMRRFGEARELLKSVDDLPVRSQVGPLIDFAESGAALAQRDTQWAFTLANTLRPGVKRAMLYAGLIAASPGRDEALGYLSLGLRDTELLPAEQRMLTTAAFASALGRIDAETALNTLGMLVNAANDAYLSPRKGRYNPQVARRNALGNGTTFTDSSLILANSRCLCETVDTGRGRHNFPLQPPNADITSLTGVVRNASRLDPGRVEATLLGLRDEALLAAGLNALAALRLQR